MEKKIYNKSIFYVILFVLFSVFTYLFIISGFNTKTKVKVNYQEDSNILYKVYLLDNDIYTQKYLEMDEKYISKLVSDIDLTIKYQDIFSEYTSGYYRYNVTGTLIAYRDDIQENLWEKNYTLVPNKTIILNQNDINTIKISDNVIIDYQNYVSEINNFKKEYDMDISGYLLIKMNVTESLNFDSLGQEHTNENSVDIMIPINEDTFRISQINKSKGINSYYEFVTEEPMNYMLLLLGVVFGSLAITFGIVVIREFKIIANRQSKYTKKLKKILNTYGDSIINIKKFYNKKKYNLIYVDSFEELLDVYNKKEIPICFKEIRRGYESIFVIIDDDNAWIYRMILDKI